MTKKHFIALADAIKFSSVPFSQEHLVVLADFCRGENSQFNRERWLDYIAGKCGPLVITLTSTIGIQHPVILHGETPHYASYGECKQAGEHVVEWLTQDFVKVTYDCTPIVVQEDDCTNSFTDTCVGCTDDCLEPLTKE